MYHKNRWNNNRWCWGKKYYDTAGSLWFYSKDKATDFDADILNNDNNFKYFEYKVKLLEYTVAQPTLNQTNGVLKNSTIFVPLRDLSNFGRSHEKPLINCKVELKLRWTKHYFLSVFVADGNGDGANTSNIVFTIKDTKLFLPVLSLSAKDNKRLSKLLKLQGFQKSAYWNEYKTKRYLQRKELWMLFNYEYIKSHHRLIAVNLSRQKGLDAGPKAIQKMESVG